MPAMDGVLYGAYESYRVLLFVAAIGYFAFWARSRFWLPVYAHVLATIGLVVGAATLLAMPPDAPINREAHAWLWKGGMLAVFPAMVYFFFIFYGGQAAAYRRMHAEPEVECPSCGVRKAPEAPCPSCDDS